MIEIKPDIMSNQLRDVDIKYCLATNEPIRMEPNLEKKNKNQEKKI